MKNRFQNCIEVIFVAGVLAMTACQGSSTVGGTDKVGNVVSDRLDEKLIGAWRSACDGNQHETEILFKDGAPQDNELDISDVTFSDTDKSCTTQTAIQDFAVNTHYSYEVKDTGHKARGILTITQSSPNNVKVKQFVVSVMKTAKGFELYMKSLDGSEPTQIYYR